MGADRGGNASLNAEWVKIRNATARTRTLTGWTLRDLYWGKSWYIWNNDGDTAALKNASGVRIDRCSYTSSANPEAFC